MSNGMQKLFVIAAVLVFIVILLLFPVLPNSITGSDDQSSIEWSYAIVVDAGSTGSRLFLYKYRSVTDEELIDIKPVIDELTLSAVVKKVTPGLSSFRDKPQDAAVYIKPLLDYAVQFIPPDLRPFTTLFIFATAGMRLLTKDEQDEILKNLHHDLPSLTSIQIIPEHIKVIEGKWEGIYSWIAVNYILGRFKRNSTEISRQHTVGIVDMGGASVQLAVELNSTDEKFGGTVENINLGCRDDDLTYRYRLYVTTFLGYGVNEALRKYEQKLGNDLLAENTNSSYIRDPCLPKNLLKTVNRQDGSQFSRRGYGDWDICVNNLTSLLKADVANSDCYALKCFFGLVPAPTVSLSDIELYGFSEYWFSLEDVLSMGGSYNFNTIASRARDFCRMKWSIIQMQYKRDFYPKADDDRLRTQCFKSAWITAVLHEGFSISKIHNRFRSVFSIDGQEVHWALGSLLYHMRYFPLRETIQRTLQHSNHRITTKRSSLYWTISLVVVFIILLGILYKASRRRYLRRDPSMWGYMMLSQDQYYMEP